MLKLQSYLTIFIYISLIHFKNKKKNNKKISNCPVTFLLSAGFLAGSWTAVE